MEVDLSRSSHGRGLRAIPGDRQGGHIGLLPDIGERNQVRGERSLLGAYLMELSKNLSGRSSDHIAHRMTYLELSTNSGFIDQSYQSLFLPHTHIDQFPTVKLKARGAR